MLNSYYTSSKNMIESGFTTEGNMAVEDVVDILKRLTEVNTDGRDGFKQASDGIKSQKYSAVFDEFARQRESFALELQEIVNILGGETHLASTRTGSLHRNWINIKAAVAGHDPDAILNECERGENASKAAYDNALKNPLPIQVAEILRRQSLAIHNAHDSIRAMRLADTDMVDIYQTA